MTIALELANVDLVRSNSQILQDVSLTVRSNERWAVLGPNGSGKSTILRLAGASLHPTRGEVRVLGERLGSVDVRELRRRIAFSGGSIIREFDHNLTFEEVVLTGCSASLAPWWDHYNDEERSHAHSLMDELGIGALRDRSFGVGSEGERQRAVVARSLMARAELLLLDEPFAGLDMGARERLVARLGNVAVDPKSPPMVLVTHHAEEIPAGITHGALVEGGRIVVAGPVGDVLTDTLLTKTFGIPLSVINHGGRWHCVAS